MSLIYLPLTKSFGSTNDGKLSCSVQSRSPIKDVTTYVCRFSWFIIEFFVSVCNANKLRIDQLDSPESESQSWNQLRKLTSFESYTSRSVNSIRKEIQSHLTNSEESTELDGSEKSFNYLATRLSKNILIQLY